MKLTAVFAVAFTVVNAGGVAAFARHQSIGNVAPLLKGRALTCGVGVGKCPPGSCCSESGFCGTTEDFCSGSQCQLEFSDSCDTFLGPPGKSTESIERPLVGKVPYGTIIKGCTEPGTVALTFDDGPYIYTPQILDILAKLNVKATFFITGKNRGKHRIDDEASEWPGMLRKMHEAGHQIASHTWTHRNLNQVSGGLQHTEMIYNEMAFRNIFGFFPTYMRAPYLECSSDSGCTGLMETLGYHIIDCNIDTKDYENDDPALINISKNRYASGLSTNPQGQGYITLAHDVHYQTVVTLTEYMVKLAKDRGYKLVTVGECLGDGPENWYRNAPYKRTTTTKVTRPTQATTTTTWAKPTTTSIISTDQRCGGEKGQTCRGSKFGNCCSFYGYCGSSVEYCGTGCSPDFGTCNPINGGVTNTTNGLCGAHFSTTCSNYGTKNCCSQFGYCGSTDAYCGQGCQKGYGKCN